MLKSGTTIMIVEDEEDFRTYLNMTLKKMGVTVIAKASVVEAFQHLTEGEKPHLILSDINLPGASGIELIEALRESGYHMPVILMSAVRSLNETEFKATGAASFIQKPFKAADLEKLLAAALA